MTFGQGPMTGQKPSWAFGGLEMFYFFIWVAVMHMYLLGCTLRLCTLMLCCYMLHFNRSLSLTMKTQSEQVITGVTGLKEGFLKTEK